MPGTEIGMTMIPWYIVLGVNRESDNGRFRREMRARDGSLLFYRTICNSCSVIKNQGIVKSISGNVSVCILSSDLAIQVERKLG